MTKNNLLQNTPKSREPLPNKVDAKSIAKFFNNNQGKIYLLGLLLFFFISILYYAVTGGAINSPAIDTTNFLLWIGVIGILMVAALFYLVYKRSASIPTKEQLRYYELGNVKPLSAEQAKALRLHIVEMYHDGFWLNTLEYFPCNVRVNNPKFSPTSFFVADKSIYKAGINEDWGIVSKEQYEQMVEDLFGGMHSQLFAIDMDYTIHYASYARGGSPDDLKKINAGNQNFINRMAGLVEKSSSYVMECFQERAGKPKPLLWGFDLWRVIAMSREAFMAGYATEEEAWKNITKASSLIYYLFDDFESFYDNRRLGAAYWSNDLKTTTAHMGMWKLYNEQCDWPQKDLPWTMDSVPEIPDEMRTGFAGYIQSKNKLHKEVGFKIDNQDRHG